MKTNPILSISYPLLRSLRFCVTVLFLITLTGCAQALPKVEPVELTFVVPQNESAHYQALIKMFQSQAPEVTVKLVPADRRNIGDFSGTRVDCYEIPMYALYEVQSQGELENVARNLDEYVKQEDNFNLRDFYPGSLEQVRSGGKLWAIPAGVNPTVMFYNKDLFDSLNAPYPQIGWTWDDFINAAVSVSDPGAGIWGYAPISVIDPIMFIYQHGGTIVDSIEDPTRTTFDDPKTVDAMQWYARLFHEYQVAPQKKEDLGSVSSYTEGVYRAIFGGKIGMWSGTYQERGGNAYVGAKWPFKWGMVGLPRDERSATFADVEAYMISAKSSHPDVCWNLIAFLSKQVTGDFQLVPARKSLVESTIYSQVVGKETATVVRTALENAIIPPSAERFMALQSVLVAFSQATEKIASGEMTVQEAMEFVQKQAGGN